VYGIDARQSKLVAERTMRLKKASSQAIAANVQK
jgi:hypothetical protein